MKLKRLTATMLALLLMVSLLPMAAMADDLPDNSVGQVPINQPIGTNIGTGVEINTNGSVQTNSGSVAENRGTVVNNNGTVVGNMDGGTVENNNAGATVQYNYAGATVENNKVNATVIDNHGLVGKKDENGNLIIGGSSGNSGNSGTVENNMEGGIVTNNTGTVENNYAGATVIDNYGLVGKYENGLLITDGSFGNFGTVVNNNAGGVVSNNGGTVVSNSGIVCNNTDGSVVTVNEVDGIVSNDSKGPGADGPKVEINFGTVNYPGNDCIHTYYGVHYEVDGKKVYIDQFENRNPVTISDLKISRPGFKLAYCQAVEKYDSREPNRFVDVTNDDYTTKNDDGSVQSFIIQAPTRLKLLWEKIVTAVAPAASTDSTPEAKPVKAAALPSTVAAEDVKVGTVVRVKGQLFRVIEMDDGSMTVVTMGKLSKKDMEDLTAFLAKYFTPEQIELLLGDPELISGALAEELFGGNTGHIVFKAARNLFA